MSEGPGRPTVPRPRGRPRVVDKGSSATCWLPEGDHDRLIELAKRREASVSETMRKILTATLRQMR